MQIKEMFRKEIDRELQGVIVVGQGAETNVAQELEEYVVTRELQRHFADFFAAYKKGILGTTPKMGVWISGFFGSGKSHFLKILSYLLENKQVGDKHALDFFIDDKKITNQMVLADMKLAADTPTDVILFNIDSKSESNSKENKDAIVNVFLKVFNEMQGFCGSMPYLADLERHLAEADQLAAFKEKFEDAYGDAWEDSRQDFDFIQDTVVEVLVEMGFMSEPAARNWCEKATEPYQISIEDFAKRVKAYLDKKGRGRAQSAAAMFAAKEAVAKALGTGFSGGVMPWNISVVHDEKGAPGAELTGAAKARMEQIGGRNVMLSLSHEGGSAIAFAVIGGF